MLKIGLIGVGGISGAHIPAWNTMEDAELVALCDVRPERMEAYTDKRCYTSFSDMLEHEQLDILDICLPTYLHADYSICAMEHGINVICEKPISLKKEDVARVYATAEKYGVKFMVAQVLRFWPEYTLIRELYTSKKYGKLLSGSMSRLGQCPGWSWDNWMRDEKRSGLVPFDLHIHDLDFLVYAFGKPMHTQVFRSRQPDQDYLRAVYEFDDFFVSAEASWFASPYPFRMSFRFQFENAVAAFENDKLMIYERDGNVLDLSAADGKDTGDIQLPKSDAYANEIRYFADCVKQNQSACRVKPEELETVINLLSQS